MKSSYSTGNIFLDELEIMHNVAFLPMFLPIDPLQAIFLCKLAPFHVGVAFILVADLSSFELLRVLCSPVYSF